jgi:hypothetical protein
MPKVPVRANQMDEAGEWPHNVAARRMGVSVISGEGGTAPHTQFWEGVPSSLFISIHLDIVHL